MSSLPRQQRCLRSIWATEAERRHLARELHDQIMQVLIVMTHRLAEVPLAHRPEIYQWQQQLQQDLAQAIQSVRGVCGELRLPPIDAGDLRSDIVEYMRVFRQHAPCSLRVDIEGELTRLVPQEVCICLMRVLQEALCNAAKHAAARQITVSVCFLDAEILLSVEDDGVGFQVPALRQLLDARHYGLLGMYERLMVLGGQLEVHSRPGGGTRVCARLGMVIDEMMCDACSATCHC